MIADWHGCSPASLYIWNNKYNGTRDSLKFKVNPKRHIWNKYSKKDMQVVKNMIESESCGRLEMYGRLQTEFGFKKSIRTLYRMLKILNVAPVQDLQKYIPQLYNTPKMLGVKWQIDIKYVLRNCLGNIKNSVYHCKYGSRLYQYTCVDEATRKRFIYAYESIGKRETIDFIKRCIVFFGYKPLMVQTDNGCEFTNTNVNTKQEHLFTRWLHSEGIEHRLICPATPRHNGKVERSHRTDNQEFYSLYQEQNGFTSLEHLRDRMKDWCYRYNNVRVMSVLNYKTPSKVEHELLQQLHTNNGQVTYIDLYRSKIKHARQQEKEFTGIIQFTPQNHNWAFATRPLVNIPDIA